MIVLVDDHKADSYSRWSGGGLYKPPLYIGKRFSGLIQWRVVEWAFRRRGQSGTVVPYSLSSLFCPIYDHNSLQYHYGNWEAIICERRPKWCLNKKTIMKVKAGKTLLNSVKKWVMMKKKNTRDDFVLFLVKRLDKLSIDSVQFRILDN